MTTLCSLKAFWLIKNEVFFLYSFIKWKVEYLELWVIFFQTIATMIFVFLSIVTDWNQSVVKLSKLGFFEGHEHEIWNILLK